MLPYSSPAPIGACCRRTCRIEDTQSPRRPITFGVVRFDVNLSDGAACCGIPDLESPFLKKVGIALGDPEYFLDGVVIEENANGRFCCAISGKPTFARRHLPGYGVIHFVNADLIASELSPLRSDLPAPPRVCCCESWHGARPSTQSTTSIWRDLKGTDVNQRNNYPSTHERDWHTCTIPALFRTLDQQVTGLSMVFSIFKVS
jgi:hypothetical protein